MADWLDDFCEHGFAVVDDFLPLEACRAIAALENESWKNGKFRPARVGRIDPAREERERSDWIRWLEEGEERGTHAPFFSAIEVLRERLRSEAFLPVNASEFHAALYEPGAFYKKHVDVFRELDSGRLVSCVYYLNEGWNAEDGGQLRIYLESGIRDVVPVANRLVIFQSRKWPHEVLPASRARYSLTGWLKSSNISS